MSSSNELEDAQQRLEAARLRYSDTCRVTQLARQEVEDQDIPEPEDIATLAIARHEQSIAMKELGAADRAVKRLVKVYSKQVPILSASIRERLENLKNKTNIKALKHTEFMRETFGQSPAFQEMKEAALRLIAEKQAREIPHEEFDFSSLESEPIQCGELRTDISSAPPKDISTNREIDPLEEFDQE